MAACTWRQLPVRGMSPLPRFSFGAAPFAPGDGGSGPQLLVFGGVTGAACALNDVWSADLPHDGRWTQLAWPQFATSACKRQFG